MAELKLLVVQLTIKLNHDWSKIKECLEKNNNPVEQCLEIYNQLPKEGLAELQTELSQVRIKEIREMLANLERQYMALDQQSAQSIEFDSVQTIETIDEEKEREPLEPTMETNHKTESTPSKSNSKVNVESDHEMDVDPVEDELPQDIELENKVVNETETKDLSPESEVADESKEDSEQNSSETSIQLDSAKMEQLRPIALKKQESSDISDLDSTEGWQKLIIEETKKKKNSTWQKTALMIWDKIADHRAGNLFLKQPKDITYSKFILQPMCLETVKSRIRNRQVQTTAEFHRDVMQVLANAVVYNNDQELYEMALELKQYTDVEMQNFLILHPE
ncbi:hypothetical protein HDV01_007047 [Terramyces sp. JEL0728]|nr:hypothetical protein HDV01_007047 [Terramyces sp. JEL0728]